MKRRNFRASKEERLANLEERRATLKIPTTDTGFCQNCGNAPSPVRHGLRCQGEGSPHEGQYVARKCSCAVFVQRNG
jgi:hypothetical protein